MKSRFTLKWTNGSIIKEHGSYESIDDAIKAVQSWWKENNFEPRYFRLWTKGKVTTIDYGSRTMRYKIYEEK